MIGFLDIYRAGFMQRALLEALLVGALCGAVGAHVVLRRLPFFTITIAHGTFPGIVIAAIVGMSELVGGLAFAAVLVGVIYLVTGTQDLDTNTAIGVALAGSLGLGVMLQSTQDGFSRQLTAILVGSVLTVDSGDLIATAVVGVAVVGFCTLAHKELVFRAFDPGGAEAQGYPRWLDLGLLLAVAATVVTTVPAVGTILSVALLSVPALTARLITRRVGPAIVCGAGFGAASGVSGVVASAEFDIAAGPAITLSAALLFFFTLVVHGVFERRPAPITPELRGSPHRVPQGAAPS